MIAAPRPAAPASREPFPPGALTTLASALVQAVSSTPAEDAAHLAVALRMYRKQGRAPASFAMLERVFADVWHRSSEVTAGQRGAIVAAPPPADDRSVMPETLLDRQATARRLDCSESTVKRREQAGELPAVRHGRIVRYRAADVDTLTKGQA